MLSPALEQPKAGPKWVRSLLSPDILAPIIVGLVLLTAWELAVRITNTPPYLLPGPLLILQTLATDWPTLLPSWFVTIKIAFTALVAATVSGLFVAILFAQSKWIERSFFPYAVLLQTTPIVAVAPLIIIWLKNNTFAALVVCAWIVAFFPIVSNTVLGLHSADPSLVNLFKLNQANRWQTLWYLRLPTSLPYFLAGLRISGGLALIGAVVAEFVAGTGGAESGLAYQILIAGYNLQIPRMFAALLLITVSGIAIFALLSALSNVLLKDWHSSAMKHEN
ncbi:ABC transporter permease [Nodosilinea sp. LEGE 07298]|uniref:ABC transporter permease n=1 Tax=Nodosilinea sp. LEGE 07298 TaxID=2777970 RepID=UPI00187FF6C2|nr:ABC transporter permease [Nodosilinea sp. LEGE 07298]MBE9112980.1 ABC transporter permease [Nodosilinea sp. LEGE 07298]